MKYSENAKSGSTRNRWVVATLFMSFLCSIPVSRAEEDRHRDHADESTHERGRGADHEDQDGVIRLTSEDALDFGILIATAGPGTIREGLRVPGEIRMNEDSSAHIGPRFDSVVTAIHRRLGDRVSAGETLAVMESNDTLRPFELVAPIDGTIVDFHATLGESFEAGEYVFIVADTSTVWADLRVYQRDLLMMVPELEVTISAGHDFPDAKGVVAYIGPVVDEVTRTGLVRVVLDNPEGIYRPGLFIIGRIVLDETEFPVVVPLSAVHSVDGMTVVYVASKDGQEFEQREVVLGHRDGERAEVGRGVEAGELYVAEGGFFLKADSRKEDFGDGHDH